jgi:hypothetical protein
MENLIAELERATEGSLELDLAISEQIGDFQQSKKDYEQDGRWSGKLPLYTTSLDAALTLVPDGWHVNITGEQGSSGWGVCLTSGQLQEKIGLAPTLALALCIVSLRARQAIEEDG